LGFSQQAFQAFIVECSELLHCEHL
jgi:hypothetical protein